MSAAQTLPAMLAEGRWHGRWYEQPCLQCGCMLALREPVREGIRCAGCRGEFVVADVQQALADLIEERNAWRARALTAELRLREAGDDIEELRAMNERGRVEL